MKARTTSLISAMETCDRKLQRQNDMTSAPKHHRTLKKTRTTLQGTNSSVQQMGTNNQLGVCYGRIQLELREELTLISALVQSLPVIRCKVHKSICLLKLNYINPFESLPGFDCTSELKDTSFKSEESASS